MATRKAQAWITFALNDGTVSSATVLAESIRRTKTTRTIAAITSKNVSQEKRKLLKQVFDIVFCMDAEEHKNMSACLFALSLTFLEKCVFLEPNYLVLENVDTLFEDEFVFKLLTNGKTNCIDWSIFTYKPTKQMWNFLEENKVSQVNLYKALTIWLENQYRKPKMGGILDTQIGKLDVSSGTLELKERFDAPIIQLLGVENLKCELGEQLELLFQHEKLGLPEKLMVQTWLTLKKNLDAPKPFVGMPMAVEFQGYKTEPIAIIGMSCRYPGANSIEEFWNMLYEGEEGVREPPAFRWTKEHSLRVTQQERKTNAGFLSTSVDEFDAKFFGVSPKEAAYMDPQARILHEILWESLEDAGIDPLSLYGSHTGIFTGSWMNDYKDIVQASSERDFFRTYMGNSIGAAAARLSFLLGLTGPSVATESGCSSAIVALDIAVKSLRNGETNLALAGGVNLLLHPFTSNIMDYVISPDGRCKTFDAKANGFGRAEGCGVLVLKRLSDALRDGDNIWAMIRGSAVSQEGLSRSLGTPTVHCEALAMQLALKDAGVWPEQVTFVETHGTGTSVGDPMEVAAIAKAYHSPLRSTPLVIGSVKTNVGHTESCSGITGIMKAVLAMQHQLIPKHRNLETLNPEIFLDSIPAMIPMEPVAWPKKKGQPRLAGVSSFGITGTDGHVIIEESPDIELPRNKLGLERPLHLLKISGKTKEALDELLEKYTKMFSENKDISFADASFTANVGRASFSHRAFIVAGDAQGAAKALAEKQYFAGDDNGQSRKICFLFTGQGAQYPGMAKQLYSSSPVFRVHFDACDKTLCKLYNLSLQPVLWESETGTELSRTIFSQTSIFCVEYCLLKLWESWGIKPDYVLGHSLGEFCAAVAAGVLTFEDALMLVAERSRLIDNLPQGSMLVIKASKPEVEKLLQSAKFDLDFAAVNSPDQTVVAGDTEKIQKFLNFLKNQSVKAIILDATHAFHSRHMDPMLEAYRKIAETIEYKPGHENIQYISGMEGRAIDDCTEMGANYWVRHTREKVNFVEACTVLRQSGCQDFLEIGPQPVLSSFVLMNSEGLPLNCFPSLRKSTDDWQTILNSLGKLYCLGYNVNWKGYDAPYTRKKVHLPFHPFHRKSFWVEPLAKNVAPIHPLIGYQLGNASTINIFENDLNTKHIPFLKDHCIGNRIVFPGAGYTEMCLSAGYCVANGLTETLECPIRPMKLENVRIDAPLELKSEKNCLVQVIVDLPEVNESPDNQQGFRVKVYHQNNSAEESGKWVLHASSTFLPVASTKTCLEKWKPATISEVVSTGELKSTEAFYKRANDTGLRFGESFKMLQRFWRRRQPNCKEDTDEIVAEMDLPSDYGKYLVHPLIIDAAFQARMLAQDKYKADKLRVPVRIGQLTLFSGISRDDKDDDESGTLTLYAWLDNGKYSVFVSRANSQSPIMLMEDIELIATTIGTIESVLEQQSSALPDAWEETWKPIPISYTNSMQPVNVQGILTNVELQGKLQTLRNTSAEDVHLNKSTNHLVLLYTLNALYELGWKPSLGQVLTIDEFITELGIQPEFQKWVGFYLRMMVQDGLLAQEGPSWKVVKLPPAPAQVVVEKEELFNTLKNSKHSVTINIYQNIAVNLSQILKGEKSALSILFPQEPEKECISAETYYQNYPGHSALFSTLELLCENIFKESQLQNSSSGKIFRVLEVGSGTGSLSRHLLSWLRAGWNTQFELWYTDISNSFLVRAEKKFEEFKENVKYSIFNLEQSPLSQGIPLQYFDMVMGRDVLHATRDLEECLVHLRQTLKPEGVLCFVESQVCRDITFVFGLLEGYWRFQDFKWRQHHCCVSPEVWEQLLHKTGYRDVNSFPIFCDNGMAITAVADSGVKIDRLLCESVYLSADTLPKWVIFADATSFGVLAQVANILHASGNQVEMVFRKDCQPEGMEMDTRLNKIVGKRVITADNTEPEEMESVLGAQDKLQGVIYAWGMNTEEREQKFVALPFLHIGKALIASGTKPSQVLVLTRGVHAINEDATCSHPTGATLFGMVKSLKNENYEDIIIKCVDLEGGVVEEDSMVAQILFEIALSQGHVAKEKQRVQVVYKDNVRYEPRFVKGSVQSEKNQLKLPMGTDRYQLKLPSSRVIQDLTFDVLEEMSVGEHQIEVNVKAYALNFRDLLTILKPSKYFEQYNAVGLDFGGVVTKAGAKAGWKVGDRVFGANFADDQLPSYLVMESQAVVQIPEGISYWQAATLPAVFTTAYHCLINVARLGKGESVLIHTGSGGVGLAAIQVARHVGAEIITTAGSARKRAYLRSLGIQHVFRSRDTDYEKDILRVTNGKGVNVVLNSITGPGFKEATLNATAKNGRFIEMSKLSVWSPEEVKLLRPDVDYKIVDLTTLESHQWKELLDVMDTFLGKGYLSPIPYVKFDALNIRQALQHLQKAKHIGKVVVTMPEVQPYQGQWNVNVSLFNEHSTYLITGGLGGIGFEVCKWMLERGATDIVLTGRSAPQPEIAQQITKLNENGANVQVRLGDIGDYQHCKYLVEKIAVKGKPLRGIMHCAGVLRDGLYVNQTWEAFKATYTPKVTGTWNLHNLTRHINLEHFVVYSSLTALVGTPGQANHASANCFEDAFVHYRHSLGLPGTSVNWGQWAQVGVAKEINIPGVHPVSVQRMFKGLEISLRTNLKQVCFSEFESLTNLGIMCPTLKNYVDERIWKQYHGSGGAQNAQCHKADQFWKEMDEVASKKEKVGVMCVYLKIILRTALRLDQDEPMKDDANIQELGVDSLMMLELKNSIQSLLGNRVNVTASMLKNCNTIRLIAQAVVDKLVEEEENLEELETFEPLPAPELLELLAKDCILDSEIKPVSEAGKPSEIRRILVTGATGQLGAHILSILSRDYGQVEKITCLVKGSSPIDNLSAALKAKGLEVDMTKVECLSGDVAKPCLGLNLKEYNQLCETVDGVIHCAAKIHPLEPYKQFENKFGDIRSINVGGTRNLLRFASTGKTKHFYYPSSVLCGLLSNNMDSGLSDNWPENGVIETVVSSKLLGLQSTRFVAELLIRQANERGIPCKVFRFPWIAGNSKTGQLSVLNNMYIMRFLSFLKTGAMTEQVVPANFVPVDLCAEYSVNLFMRDDTPCEVFNLAHPHPQVEQEFVQIAQSEFGKTLEVLGVEQFVQKCNKLAEDNNGVKEEWESQGLLGSYLGEAMGIMKGYAVAPDTFFVNEKVSKYIINYGEDFAESMDILRRDLRYLKGTGVLEQFGI